MTRVCLIQSFLPEEGKGRAVVRVSIAVRKYLQGRSSLFTFPHHSPPRKKEAGTQDRNLEAGTEAEAVAA